MRRLIAAAAFFASAAAVAQEPPVPKMFQGVQGEKGQWQVEFLDMGGAGAGKGKPPTMTVCTDNLAGQQRGTGAGRDPSCKYRLIKDTATEAVIESECPERKSTVVMKRESAKSVLMTATSSGPRGERSMTMRYTHLGACRDGQGGIQLDPDSEQCRRMKERRAKLDPEKACARTKGDRAECERRVREAAEKLSAMCG